MNEGLGFRDGSLQDEVEDGEDGMHAGGLFSPEQDGVRQVADAEGANWGVAGVSPTEISDETWGGPYRYEHLETERDVYVSVTLFTYPDSDEISLDLRDDTEREEESRNELRGMEEDDFEDISVFLSLVAVANGDWLPSIETDEDSAQ